MGSERRELTFGRRFYAANDGRLHDIPSLMYNKGYSAGARGPGVVGERRMAQYWWLPIAAVVLLAAACLWYPRRRTSGRVRLVQAKRRFHAQREGLEAKFIQLAAAHAEPNAPRWADCSFADDVAYVRNRSTGELSAFVALTVGAEGFDRLPAGGADAVGDLQAGTAVFRFDRDHWVTDGRAFLNLSPNEAVRRYGDDLEVVGEELAHRF